MSEPHSCSPFQHGVDVIKDNLLRLPAKPGVYRMFDRHDTVLYVGKAKNLKARIAAYTRIGGHTQRIAAMIMRTARMEFVITDTEAEALLLEAGLIKSLKPRYNILLRDDKSFPYILIRRDHEAPQVRKYRGSKQGQGDYFGPFANSAAVTRTIDTLQKAFLLRTCEDSVYATRQRPCMLYQIKRCAAPCVGLIESEAYNQLTREAADFLRGKAKDLHEQLAADMEKAAISMEFERAAVLRDRIRALAAVRASKDINPEGINEADVFAIVVQGGLSVVQVFFIRAGLHWGASVHFPRHEKDDDAGAILAAFLVQFYDKRPPPRLILVNILPVQARLLAEALESKGPHRVRLHRPQRGSKHALIRHAFHNAREALTRKLTEQASHTRLLAETAKVFGLPKSPERIEIYDNAHIQGSNMVGGMVVAGVNGFEKNQYRKFVIRDKTFKPGDDYGMMREVMHRRFARALEEKRAGHTVAWPDMVLIDGGAGQLSSTLAALADLGLEQTDVNLVAMAKGRERNAGREQFFQPGKAPFALPEKAPVLYYLQRLRDEAHRWATGAHRARRSRDIRKNPLDEIEGVGPARKRMLLRHFGSAAGVAEAKLVDLCAVKGVSAALAKRIHDHFNSG